MVIPGWLRVVFGRVDTYLALLSRYLNADRAFLAYTFYVKVLHFSMTRKLVVWILLLQIDSSVITSTGNNVVQMVDNLSKILFCRQTKQMLR